MGLEKRYNCPLKWVDVFKENQQEPSLPQVGRRCRFELKACEFTTEKGSMKAPKGLQVYGYRANERVIYVPLHKGLLTHYMVERWTYDDCCPITHKQLPLFYNGGGRDPYEAFHVMSKRRFL